VNVAAPVSLKGSWRRVALGEILTLVNGRAYKQSELLESGTPVLRIQNLNGGDRWYYSNLTLPDDKYCEKGDLLFAWSATFGPYVWSGSRAIYHYHIWKVIPSSHLDKNYAFYLLRSITERVKASGRGISMVHMTKAGMEAWEVDLPPLDEQRRIAAILDKADGLRRKRKRAFELLGSIGQAVFESLERKVDEARVPFEEAAYFQEGPGVRNWQFKENGIKLINVRNIVNGVLDLSNTNRFLSEEEVSIRYKHFLLEPGDLVIASSGVTWGKVAEVKKADLPLCLNTSMIRIRPRAPFRKAYVRQFIEFGDFRSQIQRLITGSAQPNFGPSHLKQVLIPRLSEHLQLRVERTSAQCGSIREAFSSAQDTSELLFSSLQHRAFSGQL
jgi:type I restriction enzyme S subunit